MSNPIIVREWRSLVLFFLASYAVFAFGGLFQPGDWYQSLNKASWSPPNIAFPIVWLILYAFIAIAGWLTYINGNIRLTKLWGAQLIINGLWSWIFFGQHWVLIGLIDLLLLVILVVSLIVGAISSGLRSCAYLLIPYLLWLVLATSLNVYILIFN